MPNSHKKVWWQCRRGHEWEAVVASRNRGIGCPYCHSKSSQLELRLYTELKYLFKEVRLREKIIGKECDIFMPNINLGIEIDGKYWHKEKQHIDKEKIDILKGRESL